MEGKEISTKDIWGWLDEWESERNRLLQDYQDGEPMGAFIFDLGVNCFKNFICQKIEEAESEE